MGKVRYTAIVAALLGLMALALSFLSGYDRIAIVFAIVSAAFAVMSLNEGD